MPPSSRAAATAPIGISAADRAALHWRAGVSSIALLAALSLAGSPPAAARGKPALPQGGSFAAGAGIISSGGSTLTVTQSTLRGIIDWSRFSIGTGGVVQIRNGRGATLNRVTGGQQSQLLGTLTATGSVYLINPAGVLIGKNGVVNTGGSFIASTLDVSNDAFLSGGSLTFAGSSAAAVKNAGTIAASGGDVFLIARTVENSGGIAAPNGTAGLAAGQQVLLQEESSDQRIFVQGPGGNVTNSGTIAAAAAELKAAGGNVYALAGNNGGQITATGTAVRNGRVWLTAQGGSVTISGKVSARNADGSGGQVEVESDRSATVDGTIDVAATAAAKDGGTVTVDAPSVDVGATAVLDAIGTAQGGTVLLGASEGSDKPRRTTIASGAQLLASGSGPGAGGSIETSGQTISLGDATVSAGSGGSWLINASSLVIDGAAASAIARSLDAGTNVAASAAGADGGHGWSGDGGDQRRSESANIKVAAAVSWDGTAGLSLTASGTIDLAAALTGAQGRLTLNADRGISATGAVDVGTFVLRGGTWEQVAAALPSFSTPDFVLAGGSFLRAGGGKGTSRSPYEITDIYGLQGLASSRTLLGSDFVLADNIDAGGTAGWNNGQGFAPIGSAAAPFRGSFDGQGRTISNLTIDRPSTDEVGLFGELAAGSAVENLALRNAAVVGANNVGALAGESAGTILQSYVNGTVKGSGNNAGGLVGRADGHGEITRSYSSSSVTAQGENVGGLAGENDGAISQAYATGAVAGADRVGGLVGSNHGTIGQTYSTGSVAASGEAGGLIGRNDGTVTASFWNSETSRQGGGGGSDSGTTGLTTAQFQNTGAFLAQAHAAGWNFNTTWAPPAAGQYPELYALSPVLWIDTADATSTYGAAPPAFSSTTHGGPASYLFGPSGDRLAQPVVGAGLGANTDAGTYALSGTSTVTSTDGVGYGVVYTGNLTIDPRVVALGGTRTYDGTTHAVASILSISNDIDGANLTLSGSGILAGKNVGSEGLSSLAGLRLGGSAAGNYTLAGASGSVEITPATLTYVAAAASRTYGAANPAFTGRVTGFVAGESLANATTGTVAFSSAATAHSSVGTYAVTGSGLGATNYVFAEAAGNAAALTVNPATLTAGLVGTVAKTYDGTTAARLTSGNYALAGIFGSDAVSLDNFANGAYDNRNVGTGKIVIVSGLALSGADAGNYVLAKASISGAVGTITPAALTASLVGSAAKTYDGTTAAALSGDNYALSGVIGGDPVALGGPSSGLYNNRNAGTGKIVSVSGLALSGADASNYMLASTDISGAIGTITPAQLSYVANPAARLFGIGNPSFSGTVIGFVGGDTQAQVAAGNPVFSTTANAASAPGSYAIDGAGLALTSPNYVLTQAAGNATALTVLPVAPVNVVPPMPPPIAAQFAPSVFAASSGFTPSVYSSAAPVVASPAASFASSSPAAGAPGVDAQPWAQSNYFPALPGNDSNRASPIHPW